MQPVATAYPVPEVVRIIVDQARSRGDVGGAVIEQDRFLRGASSQRYDWDGLDLMVIGIQDGPAAVGADDRDLKGAVRSSGDIGRADTGDVDPVGLDDAAEDGIGDGGRLAGREQGIGSSRPRSVRRCSG